MTHSHQQKVHKLELVNKCVQYSGCEPLGNGEADETFFCQLEEACCLQAIILLCQC